MGKQELCLDKLWLSYSRTNEREPCTNGHIRPSGLAFFFNVTPRHFDGLHRISPYINRVRTSSVQTVAVKKPVLPRQKLKQLPSRRVFQIPGRVTSQTTDRSPSLTPSAFPSFPLSIWPQAPPLTQRPAGSKRPTSSSGPCRNTKMGRDHRNCSL